MGAADLDAERAERMGALAFLRLRRADLVRAALNDEPRPSGNVLPFTGVRYCRDEAKPSVFEDPRWADRHKPD